MRSLNLKLVLAFLIISLVGTTLVALFMGQTTATEFDAFIFAQDRADLIAKLADYYRTHGGWEGVAEAEGLPFSRASAPDDLLAIAPPRPRIALIDDTGQVLAASPGYRPGEQAPGERRMEHGVPILVGDEMVGRLVTMRPIFAERPTRQSFLERINKALFSATLGATLVALLLSVLLARSLTGPLRELTTATQAMARGELEQRIPVRSRDELGELAESFNRMSAELVRARNQRHQMTTDIAHELRSPLSLVLGHAEALSDGVLPPSPETFDIIHDEAQRLTRLVEDLRTLSLSDAGELPLARHPVSPQALLERVVAAHTPHIQQKNISADVEVAPSVPEVNVDPDRMAQVLDNLLGNALRHTPANGHIALSARSSSAGVRIAVQDSGPGIPPEDLERIFDRLYRGDRSRQRHEGGSGLGLAIAKSIVESHDGRIWAESKLGEGATFIVELPARAANVVQE